MAKPPVPTTLTEVRPLSSTVKHYRFQFDRGASFSFKAGQFLMIHVPKPPSETAAAGGGSGAMASGPVRRAYSIASPPHDTSGVEITVDVVVKRVEGGLASNWLDSLTAGARVNVDGPYGAFLLPPTLPQELVFVCTGTGIAPFRSQIQTLIHEKSAVKMTLIFGVRFEDEILYDGEWQAIARSNPNFQYIPTVSRPKNWQGETGYVQTKIEKFVPPSPDRLVYICGLWDMISAVEKTCLGLGYGKKQIHYERYD